ncbi:MAG: hypothetical protein GF310_04340 [candidate division Zixibacteria bacterium]|nr:hypothetical protein [candidate division Zixibacteria bacterium]
MSAQQTEPEPGAEPEPPDTTEAVITDTLIEKPIEYVQYLDRDSLILQSLLPHRINNTIYTDKFSYSAGASLSPYAGFKLNRKGPYGQKEFLVFGGMPVQSFVLGDFVFDYGQFGLPVSGLTDSRLIGYEQAAHIYYPLFSTSEDINAAYCFRPPYPESGALTSAYMQKGDFGFSNTMVRFGGNIGGRGRIGFTAGFKQSDGYVDDQEKDLENFQLYGNYQLSENYQLQPDLLFFNTDDNLRFLNEFENYEGESKADFVGLSMALSMKERLWLLDRAAFIFQRFAESVRGDHDKYRHVSQMYKLKLENSINISDWHTYIDLEPFVKSIEFEPEETDYAGLKASGFSRYDLIKNLNINLSASITVSEYAENDISLAGGLSYSKCDCLILSGQIFRVTKPPSDFSLFAKSPQLDLLQITGDNGQYSFAGNSELDNTDFLGYSLGMQFEQGIITGKLFFKQAGISNSIWWSQDLTGSVPYQRDANWIVGGFDIFAELPLNIDSRIAYSYGRLEDQDSERNLAFAPRHNAYASFSKGIYIPKLNLYFMTTLEGQYHSKSYKSPYNSETVGEYFLMNAQLQFKIKTLTIFYNMDNVFNKPHRDFYDYELRRRIWWGFLWNFRN